MEKIFAYLEASRDENLKELTEYLAIPSISALPEHKEDVQAAAKWTASYLEKIGMEQVEIFQTKGHPIVYGEWLQAKDAPTVLIYGHYDVQPVDPIELWTNPPFEATIVDDKIFARGASDDKGQVFMHLKAIEAIMKTEGTLPVNVKFCLEGEEEIGSPNLPPFIETYKEKLAADYIVISDTGMVDKGRPSICYGLRGLAGIQIDITSAKGDLHSGLFGGAVPNAAHALVELVSSFHDIDGKILVEGFYDSVLPLSAEEKLAFSELETSDEQYAAMARVKEPFGEPGYTNNERTWARPTLEVNGIYGGFSGEGIKTVIPAKASAKITCRLVPNQDPDEIVELLKKHIEKHKPKAVDVEISLFDKGAPYLTPFDHPAILAAARSYESVYGVKTAYTRAGGSIPIVACFDQILKLPVILLGFGLSTENFHAPDEHFHLENFDLGLKTICTYWYELAKK